MRSRAAFRIDEDYDQAYASDGVSRYGAYLRDRVSDFAKCWNGAWGDPIGLFRSGIFRLTESTNEEVPAQLFFPTSAYVC